MPTKKSTKLKLIKGQGQKKEAKKKDTHVNEPQKTNSNSVVKPYMHPFSQFMKMRPPANTSNFVRQINMRVPRRKAG